MKTRFALMFLTVLSWGCSHLQRSPESGYRNGVQYQDERRRPIIYDRMTRQTAYELGKDPSSLTADDIEEIEKRQKLRELERGLVSKKEKEQYSKVIPWLKSDSEKISFLSIPSVEGRQQWINKKNIWSRSEAPQEEIKGLIDAQDIAVGMPQDYVRRSWGEPLSVETSGNPIYKNERWKYQRQVSTAQGFRKETRIVYFEGGRVVGWETE